MTGCYFKLCYNIYWQVCTHMYSVCTNSNEHIVIFDVQVIANTLGSPPAEQLLTTLRPLHWFSAHLHCRFEANYNHLPTGEVECTTKFLALDKPGNSNHFLEVSNL